MSRTTDIEKVASYRTRTQTHHYRFRNDYITFCGKNCEGWMLLENTGSLDIDNPWLCRLCREETLK